MVLRKTSKDILFTKGVDNKVDPKLLADNSLETLENRVFNKIGTVSKRAGFTEINNVDCEDSTLTDLNTITTFKNELLTFSDDSVYSYSSNLNKWIDKGSVSLVSTEITSVIVNEFEQTKFCQANIGNIFAYTWIDSDTSKLRYSIVDKGSDTILAADLPVDQVTVGTQLNPKVIALGNYFIFMYVVGNNLKYARISSNTPCGAMLIGNIATDLHADGIYDATVIDSNAVIGYKLITSTYLKLINVDYNLGIDNIYTSGAETIDDCLTICSYLATNETDYYITTLFKYSATEFRATQHKRNLTLWTSSSVVDSGLTTPGTRVAVGRLSSDSNISQLFWTDIQSSVPVVRKAELTGGDSTVREKEDFIRGVDIATDTFNVSDNLYINVLFESDLQATVFTVKSDKSIIAKFSPGQCGVASAIGILPSEVSVIDNVAYFPINTKGRIRSDEISTVYSLLGISSAELDFNTSSVSNTELNNLLYLAGGIVTVYDGQTVVEQGFHVYPEELVNGGTATTGGNLSDGTYLYRAVYRWTDNQGNIHRSAPSSPITITLSGGTATQTQTITVDTLRLTAKENDRRPVFIDLYRTEASGTTYYLANSTTENDLTVDTVDIVDTISDTSLIDNEILYTQGGVLDNIAAPSCDYIISHNDRLFLVGLEDKNEVRYSKPSSTRVANGFNELLGFRVDRQGGDLIASASMDANLVLLKKNNLYAVTGDGFNNTGTDSTFSDPELIASDVGCTDSNSVVLGPNGLYFKSDKGIYLLDRGLSVSYVGSGVENFNDETITSSQLLDNVNEIRFTTATGLILVYNYFFQQWSVFNNKYVTDSVVYDTTYYYISTSDEIIKEDSSTYKDLGAFVKGKVTTGWIRLSSIQGYQRVYRCKILGDYRTKHKLKVKFYNDYSPVVRQEVVIDPTEFLSIDEDYYGDGPTTAYGASSIYGGSSNGVYEFTIHLKVQKCQSIKVELEDFFTNSDINNNGQGVDLSGLSMQIGVKRGLDKTRTEKQG